MVEIKNWIEQHWTTNLKDFEPDNHNEYEILMKGSDILGNPYRLLRGDNGDIFGIYLPKNSPCGKGSDQFRRCSEMENTWLMEKYINLLPKLEMISV